MQIKRGGALPIMIRVIHTALGTASVHHRNTSVAELIYKKNVAQCRYIYCLKNGVTSSGKAGKRNPRKVALHPRLVGESYMNLIRVGSVRKSYMTVSRAMVRREHPDLRSNLPIGRGYARGQ